MYYVIDFDKLTVECKSKALKPLQKMPGLGTGVCIVADEHDIAEALTIEEMDGLYENLTLEDAPESHLSQHILQAIKEQASEIPDYDEKVHGLTYDDKPKPAKKTKPVNKVKEPVVGKSIRASDLKNKIINAGLEPGVKATHKQLQGILEEDGGMVYEDLLAHMSEHFGKNENNIRGYITDGIRKGILELGEDDEL